MSPTEAGAGPDATAASTAGSTAGSTPVPHAVAASVDEVTDLYERWGSHRYDEALSQTEHAVQTAALAAHDGASDQLVVAALLHDVGHLLDLAASGDSWVPSGEDLHHEASGSRYLSRLFPPGVTAPIALHVRAKRYRAAVDPAYLATLSDGSVASLAKQGGPMTAEEIESFEANPSYRDAVALRGWDDGGKIDGLDVAPFEHYRELMHRVAGAR